MARGGQQCGICGHAQRAEIESALMASKRYRDIASAFAVSTASLSRHRAAHMAETIRTAPEGKLLASVDAMIAEVRALQQRARRNKNAVVSSDLVLKASRELRAWFALRLQLSRAVELIPSRRAHRSEPELDDAQLATAAETFLQRRKKS